MCHSLAPVTKINDEGNLKAPGLFCLEKERARRQQIKYISVCKAFMQA